MQHSRPVTTLLPALAALVLLPVMALADSEAKRAKAINQLGFAVEEIDIVRRAADEGELEGAAKQYKRAKGYFVDAMKGIRKADPSESEREQTEIFEDRLRELDDGADLDAETVGEVADLFHEAHAYFDPEEGSE